MKSGLPCVLTINGASLAAVHGGKRIDTSMGFTPTAGLPLSTRSGDPDPSLAPYLARTEQITTKQYEPASDPHQSDRTGRHKGTPPAETGRHPRRQRWREH